MARKLPTLHPFLFSIAPILSVYAHNLMLVPVLDLGLFVLVVLAGVGALLFLLTKLSRDSGRAAVVLSTVILYLFTYPSCIVLAKSIPILGDLLSRGVAGLVLWVAGGIVVLLLAWRLGKSEASGAYFNVFGAVLLAMNVFSVGKAAFYRDGTSRTSRSIGGESGLSRPTKDVFYIVLDGYGRADQLKRVFGYDNEPFLEELRKLGFYVADKSHSNYVQTQLSMASTLNLDYVPKLLSNLSPESQERDLLNEMIDDSLVARTLRAQGYAYVAIGSGFPALRFRSADHALVDNEDIPTISSLVIALTPFARATVVLESSFQQKRRAVNRALDTIGRIAPPTSRPRFVLAHVLAPHPPFVFLEDGSPAPKGKGPYGLWDGSHFFAVGGTEKEYLEGYRQQISYLNRRVLEVVREIARRNPEAVVILQGDHGPKSHLDQGSIERTDTAEALSILNCYRVPPGVREKLYPEITPVNSFRLVIGGLMGTKMSTLPDRSYYSSWEEPYRFIDVTPLLSRP